jgi:hypothetical protein
MEKCATAEKHGGTYEIWAYRIGPFGAVLQLIGVDQVCGLEYFIECTRR